MSTPLAAGANARRDHTSAPAASQWWSVAAVTLGAFAMVTSEFLPIGLLSDVSNGLRISLGEAGWMVTVPGVVAAIAAPLMTVLAKGVDRRRLLGLMSALVAFSDLVAAMAPNFAVLLIGRLLLGIAVGGFWTFAAAVGRRLVAEQWGHRATALIMGGISAGTVLGVPAGAAMGELFGWRLAFGVLAAVAAGAVLIQTVLLPSLAVRPDTGRSSLLGAMKVHTLRLGLGAAALMVAGHFAGFTFLQPLLSDGARLAPSGQQGTLLLYGLAGLVGTWLAERAASRRVRPTFVVVAGSAGVALLVLAALALLTQHRAVPVVAWPVLVAVWGMAFGALPVCLQIWLYTAAPDKLEAASALSVVVFQVALATGALLGGTAMDRGGLPVTFLIGGGLALLAALNLMRRAAHAIETGPRPPG